MIRHNQKLGKYKIGRKLGEGGFANVYRATDTIEGRQVALKILTPEFLQQSLLDDFRHEVRIAAKLKHPNILPLKNAEMIGKYFVMAFPLGKESLAERLSRRLSVTMALDFLHQLLRAVSHAHENRVIHCDIKPDNLIIFDDNELRLSDFGIAKIALRTIAGSGSGTIGHVAPEQALGKPTFRSDVFSIGLIAYRMFGGVWLEWPFDWPPAKIGRLKERLHPEMIEWIRRSLKVDQKTRFRDATQMLQAFEMLKSKRATAKSRKPNSRVAASATTGRRTPKDWRLQRIAQFKQRFKKSLGPFHECSKCDGPVSESMKFCPWCSDQKARFTGETQFPQCCPRCLRGLKLDWEYCPWCYGGGFEVETARRYTDRRFIAICGNGKCKEKSLMSFMRYCPKCSRKTNRKWKLASSKTNCHGCGWGIADDFWSCCPWCGVAVE